MADTLALVVQPAPALTLSLTSADSLAITLSTPAALYLIISPSAAIPQTFEALSRNYQGWPAQVVWVAGEVGHIDYTRSDGAVLTKTFLRDGTGRVTAIRLSGGGLAAPITKTFIYDGTGAVTGWSYA